MEWIVWGVLFFVGLSFQLHSVFTKKRWGQLTNSVRWLRTRLWGRLIVFPAWAWLTMHWFVQDKVTGGPAIWYPVSIGAGVLLALLVDYKDFYDRGFED